MSYLDARLMEMQFLARLERDGTLTVDVLTARRVEEEKLRGLAPATTKQRGAGKEKAAKVRGKRGTKKAPDEQMGLLGEDEDG